MSSKFKKMCKMVQYCEKVMQAKCANFILCFPNFSRAQNFAQKFELNFATFCKNNVFVHIVGSYQIGSDWFQAYISYKL